MAKKIASKFSVSLKPVQKGNRFFMNRAAYNALPDGEKIKTILNVERKNLAKIERKVNHLSKDIAFHRDEIRAVLVKRKFIADKIAQLHCAYALLGR
jgi:hypothetical protein